MKAWFIVLFLIVFPALMSLPLCAQQLANPPGKYDPALINALRWRSVGPNRGGRSIACAGSASQPLEYYFGATGGGLRKTGHGSPTAQPVTDGWVNSSSIGA